MQKAPAILILAAGASRRMGGTDKLLQDVDGEPLLRRRVKAALATDAPVYVTSNPTKPEREKCLSGLDVAIVPVPDASEGMGRSLAAGIAHLTQEIPGAVILPADMPEISTEDLRKCIDAWAERPGEILRATSENGKPGHPVIFPRRLFPALAQMTGDEGARGLLRTETVRLLALPDNHALTDLDTVEDWAAWRRTRGKNE